MVSLFNYLLEASAGLALFYLVYHVFLRRETYFSANRLYLIGAALAAWVIPLVRMPSPIVTRSYPMVAGAAVEPAGPPGWLMLAAGVYFTGVGLLFLRLSIQLLRLHRFIRRGAVLRQRGLRCIMVGEDIPPFSFFHTIFLNKSRITERELSRILDHEAVHIRQLHSLDILLIEIVTILQWFNPFVWPYKSSLKETHEYLADRAVIARGGRAGYQRLILEQHLGGRLFEFANNLSQSQIKRRMTMMTKEKSRSLARLKVLLAVPAAVLLLLMFAEPRVAADTSPWEADAAFAAYEQPAAPGHAAPSIQDKQAEKDKKKQELEKKKQMEIEHKKKIAALKEKLKNTDDPDTQKKIKQYLKELEMNQGNGNGTPSLSKKEAVVKEMESLKKLLKSTEDEGKRKAIKAKLSELKEFEMKLAAKEKEMKKKQKAAEAKKK